MSIKQNLEWVLVFACLVLFSVSVLSGLGGRLGRSVLAKTADKELDLTSDDSVLVVQSNPGNNGLVSELTALMKNFEICKLSQDQLDTLSSMYQVDSEVVTVNGKDINIAGLSGNKISESKLESVFGPGKISCKIPKNSGSFFFLLAPSIS